MTSSALKAGYLLALLGILGCGSATSLGNPWAHTPAPVAGFPDRFIPDSSFTQASTSDTTCLVHLIDPPTQVRLLLVRSTHAIQGSDSTARSAVGDYKVESVRQFGLGEDELIRVACATGRTLGKVPE